MSVSDRPIEWANEMDRIMLRTDIINKENYLTDLANAVVYVKETHKKMDKLVDILNDNHIGKLCKNFTETRPAPMVCLKCYHFSNWERKEK